MFSWLRALRPAPLVLASVLLVPASSSPAAGQAPAPPPPAASQKPAGEAPDAPAWTISGYVFGDYYYFAQDHDERFDGQKGFWLRRGFLTYDHAIAPNLATRFRLEVSSNGRMAGGSLTPFVKDAFLRWTYRGSHQATLGIQPTPTLEVIDGVWGLRYVEKVAADLYKFDATRDLGVGLTGPVNAAGTIRYGAQVGNDSGTGSETDGKMAVRLAARYETNPGLFVEGSYWYSDRPMGADRQAVQVFAAYRHARGRVGLNYARQERRASAGGVPRAETHVLSGFGVLALRPHPVSIFARLDRVMDPLPDGAVDYLPISTAAPFTFGLFGLDCRLRPAVFFSPNVEFLRYDTPASPSGPRPRHDVVGRASFYWGW